MRATAALLLAAPLLSICIGPAPAAAQQAPAALIVVVGSAGTGGALRSAQVSVPALGIGGVTDEHGVVRLSLPAGNHALDVRYTGFAPHRAPVRLTSGETHRVAVTLNMKAVAIPAVRARAQPGVRYLQSRGFYDRKGQGPGRFFTRSDIEKQRPHRLSEMLRTTPGMRLAPTRFSDSRASSGRSAAGGSRCPIQYFVDGVPTVGLNIDDVSWRDVEGMEVYSSASQIPPEFNRNTALCGVIVIWTRVD